MKEILKTTLSLIVILLFSTLTLEAKTPKSKGSKTSVLVVRGGHHYDSPAFEKMCESLKGVDVDLMLNAHLYAMKIDEIKEKYDAILFFDQNKRYPELKRNKKLYMDLTDAGIGMVFLHFTLSSQPDWDEYHELVGGKWFLRSHTKDKSKVSKYYPEKTVDIKIVDPEHPITAGISDFTLTDTYYGKIYMRNGITSLLTSDDTDVAPSIAWTQKYNNSKVVYIMPGFSKGAFENPSYKKLVANALKYVGAQD
ncbi:ThuA domain-containing protein [Reichenbachiella versicolor]|uniref:ThuA domain-containing protein n=1 Tax=Reichenbachiella versicolor TaxID=1821036 RepID=UPI0013A5965A|nr:ThuA domain-containing protein [Reichenbachiella versicolor]